MKKFLKFLRVFFSVSWELIKDTSFVWMFVSVSLLWMILMRFCG
jgi:hypothetical protein